MLKSTINLDRYPNLFLSRKFFFSRELRNVPNNQTDYNL